MEATVRWAAVTAIAPVAWGTNYYVTHQFLPADYPLYGGAFRALPAGFLLLTIRRRRPTGSWWWKSLVLGTLNVGAFFTLIYVAAQLLPTSIASTIMATSPAVMSLLAWLLLAERPTAARLGGAGAGVTGVALLLLPASAGTDVVGILASITAMLMSCTGYVLAKRWSGEVDLLSSTAWQLVAGGLILVPFAIVAEGAPPTLDASAILGFAYVTLIATALAFVAWFAGLRHLDAGTVGLIGLLNPVTGVLLGTAIAGEALSLQQLGGLALVMLGIAAGQPAVGRTFHRFISRRAPVDRVLDVDEIRASTSERRARHQPRAAPLVSESD